MIIKNKKNVFIPIMIFALILGTASLKAQLVEPVVSLTGSVFNQITKEPETVFLIVKNEEGKKISAARSNSTENGYYYITGLKPGHTYYIELKQKNFMNERHKIEIADTRKYEEISKDFLVKPLKQGAEIKLQVPPFELNKSKLRYGAEFLLKDLANTLKYNHDVKFKIKCYPDSPGNEGENLRLTTDRAKSLKEFFVQKGIDASRITVKGSAVVDPQNPPPKEKQAKGKRYIGTSYIIIQDF